MELLLAAAVAAGMLLAPAAFWLGRRRIPPAERPPLPLVGVKCEHTWAIGGKTIEGAYRYVVHECTQCGAKELRKAKS